MIARCTTSLVFVGFVLSSCGPTTTSPTPSAISSPGHDFVQGELVAINNATLTVARQSTNTSVVTDPSTYFSQNWPIGVSDIKVGDCIQITGSSDTDGNISAASVADGLIPNAQCPSPTPSTSAPGPSSGLTTNQIFVGAVTATSPTSITMAGSTNAVQVNLTSSTQLTMLSGITLADLKTGTCIVAAGINQGNGTLAARTVVMTKKGVKGC